MKRKLIIRASIRIIVFGALLAWALWEIIPERDYPTYRAGGALGVCLFIVAFPFVYVFAQAIKKLFLHNAEVNTSFVKTWYQAMLFGGK